MILTHLVLFHFVAGASAQVVQRRAGIRATLTLVPRVRATVELQPL